MRSWLTLGLHARLLLAFALLNVVIATAVAGIGYVRARDAIVQRAQDNAVIETANRMEKLFPLATRTPDNAALMAIAGEVSGREGSGFAESGGRTAGTLRPDVVTTRLRAEVATGRIAWQRLSVGNATQLLIGSQLLLVDEASRDVSPSGIEVYVLRPLDDEIEVVDSLAWDAWLTGGAGLMLAMLLALVAARSVLVPVRRLRVAAQRFGEGDLDTRLSVRGRDELAAVAETFNRTAESLQRHVAELRRMEADARRFVADVSHELRTPLAAMTAVTDLLDDEVATLPPLAGQAVSLVIGETQKLTRLVNDLIEVTRFDAGAAGLALDEVDVAEALRAILLVRGFTDEVTADLVEGLRAQLDPRRLDVIVANLVGNALRHGEPPVTIRLTGGPGGLVIEVTDAGPGLDRKVVPHVFDRFFKAGPARGRSEGSGLGLAIAWENARLHGGTLVAANRPDGGASFTLRLSLSPGDAR